MFPPSLCHILIVIIKPQFIYIYGFHFHAWEAARSCLQAQAEEYGVKTPSFQLKKA
jgi:hypothetical protein